MDQFEILYAKQKGFLRGLIQKVFLEHLKSVKLFGRQFLGPDNPEQYLKKNLEKIGKYLKKNSFFGVKINSNKTIITINI